MGCKHAVCGIKILRHLAETATFITVIILCTLSSKDPFKSQTIGNMTNYFNIYPNSTTSIETMCICNNFTYDGFCSKENALEGCLNLHSDIIDFNPFLKRRLSSRSFCTDMQESFARNKGKKLEYIFDLKYQPIRKISISLIVVESSSGILIIAYYIIIIRIALLSEGLSQKADDEKSKAKKAKINVYSIVLFAISILLIIAWIGKYVLFLLLYHFIESGDIGKFDDFLDCKNVREKFFEKFDDSQKLRKCFLAFAILSIISESLDKVKDFLEKYIDTEKKIIENKSDNSSTIS